MRVQEGRPGPGKREEFQEGFFEQLVVRWEALQHQPQALLIEDSPWAYLCRHAVHVPADVRMRCQGKLAPLRVPDFTLVFFSSGVEIGRRTPHRHSQPATHSPFALRQMQQLQLHPAPTFHVDATPSIPALTKRVHTLLSSRAFHVQAGNFEGMNYLEKLGSVLQPQEAEALAKKLCLQKYSTKGEGLNRLHRLAEVVNFHPDIVNKKLTREQQGLYF